MASLKLVFGAETRKTSRVPGNISEVYGKIKEMFGVDSPYLQYKDDEDDLITIHTQEEYQDALQLVGRGCLRILVTLPPNKSTINFSDKQEMPNVFSSGASDIISRHADSSTATLAINTQETSCQAVPIPQHKTVEAAVKTAETSMNTHMNSEMGISTDFIDLSDGASNTAVFESKFIATDPLKTVSQAENTRPILVDSKAVFSNLISEKSSGKEEQQQIDSFVQSEGIEQELIESIRSIVRQELESLTGDMNKSVHEGVQCGQCGIHPIVGSVFRCSTCQNLVICEKCEEDIKHPHFFLKYKRPSQYQQSPAVQPSIVQPHVVQPPVIQPPTVQPSIVQPPVVQPSIVQPSIVQPPVVQPPRVQPPVIQPYQVQPPVIQPYQVQPVIRQVQQSNINEQLKERINEDAPARKEKPREEPKQLEAPRLIPIPTSPVTMSHLNLNDLLNQMESLGFKNKSQNISALIKANCQLDKAISLVKLENNSYNQ